MPAYEPPIEFLIEVGGLVREIMEADIVVDLALEEVEPHGECHTSRR